MRMPLYLPDSDAIIDYLRGIASSIAFVNGLVANGDILCTCSIVVGEVFSGAHPQQIARTERLLNGLLFLPTSRESARRAGEWRFAFARRGIALAMTDCQIAGTAHAFGAYLITAN